MLTRIRLDTLRGNVSIRDLKLIDEAGDSLDLLSNRIDQHTGTTGSKRKRNPRIPRAGTNVKHRSIRCRANLGKQEQGIKDVQNQTIMLVRDPREVHHFVRLNHEHEVLNASTSSFLIYIQLIGIAVCTELLDELIHMHHLIHS